MVNPRMRVPVSFIIDDSTCLVNLAHFCIPQFHEVFPDRYRQPWKSLPREIPDSFVRKFGSWCRQQGIKGKYSVIPYPACVGCSAFTVSILSQSTTVPRLFVKDRSLPLREVSQTLKLESGTWVRLPEGAVVCFDLPKGVSFLQIS